MCLLRETTLWLLRYKLLSTLYTSRECSGIEVGKRLFGTPNPKVEDTRKESSAPTLWETGLGVNLTHPKHIHLGVTELGWFLSKHA